jgi:hypothetical protein
MGTGKKIIAALGLVSLIGIGWCSYAEPRRMVRSILRIDSVPSSARRFDCRSPFTTDVVSHCYFEIDPSEFEPLLAGWPFQRSSATGSSHREGDGWPGLGDEFEIAIRYDVELHPPEFEHGGLVRLVSDSSRSKVVVDLYIE